MTETRANRTIVIFSKVASERDHLRNIVVANGGTAFCFEGETTCFDNLHSINPDAVLALTDSESLVWRFIFAIHALAIDSAFLVFSDLLKNKSFGVPGLEAEVRSISDQFQDVGLFLTIDETIINRTDTDRSNRQPLFIGETDAVKTIRSKLPGLMTAKEPLLITGESGTGKELLARIIACGTNGAHGVIKVNCAELGTEISTREGLWSFSFIDEENNFFEDDTQASQPITILLDKINNLRDDIQAEILLLLDGEVKSATKLDRNWSDSVRFIATSEERLEPLVRRGRFRKDLYYRLNVIPIHIPPLRQRVNDIPLLLDYFAIETCAKTKKSFIISTEATKESLCIYGWPGNVDELKQMMQRMAITGNESFVFAKNGIERVRKYSQEYLLKTIDIAALPDSMDIKNLLPTMKNLSLKRICEKFASKTEKKLMQKALETTNWNRKKAAALLNISYKSMLNKMKMYEII